MSWQVADKARFLSIYIWIPSLGIESKCGVLVYFRMRYVAAYLLAVLGGNNAPSTGDIEKILSSVGIEADSERLSKVVNELKGKNIEELIEQGREKLSSMPAGGAAPAAAGGAPAAAAAPAAEEKKKEEKKEESEEEDEDMGFGLFE